MNFIQLPSKPGNREQALEHRIAELSFCYSNNIETAQVRRIGVREPVKVMEPRF